MIMKEIEKFFSPKSVAVVGVSEEPGKLGSIIFNNMLDAGFKGKLYPVNPKYKELFWHKVYPLVSEIEEVVDLVVIAVPSKFVNDVLEDCGQKGVKNVIIISAGFKEIGEEGKKLENEILATATRFDIKIIGPNCLGILVPQNGVNASFTASTPRVGDVALISQSGAYCTAILDMAMPINLGFSHIISFGNKVDVDETDLLPVLLKDDAVKVVGAYLEEIKYGNKFINEVSKSAKRKPIVILKAGQTNEAKKAIISHTGAMAGDIEVYKTAFEQSGIIEVEGLRDLFNLLMAFSWSKYPKGDRIGIVTNAGGPGIVATDLVVDSGLKIAKLSEATVELLSKNLPPTANIHNPVDIIGDALADRYKTAIQALAEDNGVDAMIVIITPQLITQIEETAKIIINAIKVYDKPIIPILLGEKYMSPALSRFYDNRFAAYKDIKDAVDVLKGMVNFVTFDTNDFLSVDKVEQIIKSGKYRAEVAENIKYDQALPDELTQKMCDEVGIELPKQKVCMNLEEALEFSKNLYPVVIKALNSDLPHKTDFKAVHTNLTGESDLRAAYTVLETRLSEYFLKDKHEWSKEILIQEQVKGQEQLFIGANMNGSSGVYDQSGEGFGHLLVFGQGGIYTEIEHDMAYALVPTSIEFIKKQLMKTRVYKILDGARNQAELAIDKYVDAIESVQKMVLLYPEIKSVDINPIIVNTDRAVAVDVKVFC